MPLPPGVTVLRVTVGPYAAPDGSPAFVGARGRVTISPRVRHLATGTVLVEKPIPVRIGDDGTAAFEVPHSGQPGFDRDGWEYRLDWLDDRLRSVRFSVPVGSGDEQRLADLVASPVDRGILVPLAPGSGMASGGQTGQVLAKNSGADYDTAWTDPPDLTGYVTDDTLAAALAGSNSAPDLSSYVTDTQLAAALVGAAAGDVDLTGYVTDDELATALEDLTPRLITDAERAKLTGVAPGATANASDADLRDRITHTGHQDASTVTGLATVATSGTYGDLTGRPALAPVATSGAYPDLSGRPTLAAVALSGTYGDLADRPTIPAPTFTPVVTDYAPGTYTYTPPAGATTLEIHCIAAGGGGGGGSRYDTATGHSGGAGGGGGGYTPRSVAVADLGGQPLAVVVGVGGSGGAGASTNSGGGAAGVAGGDSTVTTGAGLAIAKANGGGGGLGGRTTTTATGGGGGTAFYGGTTGGNTTATTAVSPSSGSVTSAGGTGGGGGGYISTGGGSIALGASGGTSLTYDPRPVATTAVADPAAGGALVKGADGAAGIAVWPGLGGRGGNAVNNGRAGAGGNGGWPGGAGGGGGASLNDVGVAGTGGAGSNGVVRIVAR